jgi:DNA mismatch repair ATPase MutS
VDLVETTIDLEAAQRNEYLINSEIDAELGTLKTDLLEMEEAIEQAKDEANEALGVEAKLDRNKQFGHHLVISTKDEKTLRSSDTKYIPLQTATGKHRYTTTDFQELSDDYKEISGKYEAKQNHLVEQV